MHLTTLSQSPRLEWEQRGTHDEHLNVVGYKKVQRAKEVAALEKTIDRLQNKKVNVQAVEKIEVKNVPLSSKVMLEKDDYKTLVTAAQKYVKSIIEQHGLEHLLGQNKEQRRMWDAR